MVNLRAIGLGNALFGGTLIFCIVVIFKEQPNSITRDQEKQPIKQVQNEANERREVESVSKNDFIFLNTSLEPLTAHKSLVKMTELEAEEQFYKIHFRKHVECPNRIRLGNTKDGGWDVCNSGPFTLQKGNCLVYSFGIHFDFSFDDAISKEFGCMVHSFDPSMRTDDHARSSLVQFHNMGLIGYNPNVPTRWKVKRLAEIREILRHTDVEIDYLKFDIESSEWDSIDAMLKDGSLNNVKQLAFEIHTSELNGFKRHHPPLPAKFPSDKHTLAYYSDQFLGLEKFGFRRFHVSKNLVGQFTSLKSNKIFSCCYELYYINVNYL